jgi:N4-gp56 family major capsid protein
MTIQIDQLRNANRTKGKMTDQKSIVNFRETSRDVLGYWLADRYDQQAFLTLSGVPFTKKNNGGNRPVKATGQNMGDLEYAADISAPSTNRHFRVSGEDLVAGDIAAITSSDKFGYKHVVQALAIAKDKYLRGVKGNGGAEMFHMFLTPTGLSQLKLDSDFLANVRNAGVRGDANPLFKGGESFMLDGVMIHSYRHVFNTKGAGAGDKWGGAGNTDGQRILLCGAQSLAMADIGAPEWEEDKFDYKNQQGISIGKMCGFRKPVFHSTVDGGEEDFGVIAIDTAL